MSAPGRAAQRRNSVLLCLGLYALGVWLDLPLFLAGEHIYRDSIERGYAGMTRFFAAHPNPWSWNPWQYCGLPAQFTYLPLLHYAGAAVSWIGRTPPELAYRWLTAALACLVPVAVFLFVRYFTRSTRWALAAALAYTFFSPAYGLIRTIEQDRGLVYLPWRLHVFLKYGEGPHNAGLALFPFALMAVHRAATRRGFRALFGAAVLLAAVALTNWVAALATALAVLMMLLAAAGELDFSHLRVVQASLVGYLLACFWLTPSFVATTVFNWPADAFNYTLQQSQTWLLAGLGVLLLAMRLAFRYTGGEFYARFLTLSLAAFGWLVVVFYAHNLDTIPESRRYALEFELFLLLAVVEFGRASLASPNLVTRLSAIVPLLLMLMVGRHQVSEYVTQGWQQWRPFDRAHSVEYQIASWLASRNPQGRILASGGLRFRLNAWYPLAQVGGTFETGVRNRVPHDLLYQIRTDLESARGQEGADAILEMRALDVEYAAVNLPTSEEHYRDIRNPLKFEGLLEPVYATPSDLVYRVPFTGYAHLVRPTELPPRPPNQGRMALLKPMIAAFDDPARPRLATTWEAQDRLAISGTVPVGMLVTTSVNSSPGWQATQDGAPVPLDVNALGFLVIRARPAASTHIVLEYRGTAEQRAMAGLSIVAWLVSLAVLWRTRGRRPLERISLAGHAVPAP